MMTLYWNSIHDLHSEVAAHLLVHDLSRLAIADHHLRLSDVTTLYLDPRIHRLPPAVPFVRRLASLQTLVVQQALPESMATLPFLLACSPLLRTVHLEVLSADPRLKTTRKPFYQVGQFDQKHLTEGITVVAAQLVGALESGLLPQLEELEFDVAAPSEISTNYGESVRVASYEGTYKSDLMLQLLARSVACSLLYHLKRFGEHCVSITSAELLHFTDHNAIALRAASPRLLDALSRALLFGPTRSNGANSYEAAPLSGADLEVEGVGRCAARV